jgi:hypothetical protein
MMFVVFVGAGARLLQLMRTAHGWEIQSQRQ